MSAASGLSGATVTRLVTAGLNNHDLASAKGTRNMRPRLVAGFPDVRQSAKKDVASGRTGETAQEPAEEVTSTGSVQVGRGWTRR